MNPAEQHAQDLAKIFHSLVLVHFQCNVVKSKTERNRVELAGLTVKIDRLLRTIADMHFSANEEAQETAVRQ